MRKIYTIILLSIFSFMARSQNAPGVEKLESKIQNSEFKADDTNTFRTASVQDVVAAITFNNRSFATQTSNFVIEFDATPKTENIDGVVGISNGPASKYSDLACIVRFNNQGFVDARNGSNYSASTLSYFANRNYHFKLVISLATHTYDVFLIFSGTFETKIADDFSFRSEKITVNQLNNFSVVSDGSLSVSNFVLRECGGPVTFQNQSISNKTGDFSIEFNLTPGANGIDGVVGLSNGAASTYSKIACAVRFNTAGTIDVRNGSQYSALQSITYEPGKTYRFKMNISLTTHKYDVYVSNINYGYDFDNGETLVADDYVFRTEQNTVTQLNNIAIASNCNLGLDSLRIYSCGGPVTFTNRAITPQTDNFTIIYDVSPSSNFMDGVTGLSNGAADSYSDLACIVRFNSNGYIDLRNGNSYVNTEYTLPYREGLIYRIRMVVSMIKHTYDVYISSAFYAGMERRMGHDLAFRTEQSSVKQLSSVVTATNCDMVMRNFNVISCPGPYTFKNTSIANQTEDFIIYFEAVPGADIMDGVVGLSNGTADAYNDLACAVRFNNDGFVDARNGGTYYSSGNYPYKAGLKYAFRIAVSLTNHTYSVVFIEPIDGVEYLIGKDLAFRTEQNSVSNLNNLAIVAKSCGVSISTIFITPYDPNQFPYSFVNSAKKPTDSTEQDLITLNNEDPEQVKSVQKGRLSASVWPNPATNMINIKVESNSVFDIRDLSGKVLYSSKILAGVNEFPLNLKPGLYLLRIMGENSQVNVIKLNIK